MDKTMLIGKTGGPLAWVVVVSRGADESRSFKLGMVNNVGREAGCEVRLGDPTVSGRHSCIRYEHGQYVLHDLASRNRTYLNGKVLGAPCGLMDGDMIRIGDSELVFKQAR